MNRQEIIWFLESERDIQQLDSSKNLLTSILNSIENHREDEIDMSTYGEMVTPPEIIEKSHDSTSILGRLFKRKSSKVKEANK